ncbi:Hypothetical predicted protein [Paramuricea clavata]|uniref:Uncharacterized protein n=1 Tax=Paramuricea clavata TaxID=317549 RepID=A0A7D9LUS1_PARCT|nr:Hypothetical predicted protein [Paramuricea clavata]
MKQLQTTPRFKEIFERFTVYGNHVVRYSCHDRSGTWTDICIEQKLMKAAKSEGGLSRGRMRNSDSGHKCWVQTLNHFSDVNQRMEESVKKHGPLHKDLTKTRMKRDAEAIGLVLKWFEENNPFDHDRDNKLLVSFSTGFTSKEGDAVNAERAVEVGREMQIKLNGQSVTSTMELKFKVQALSPLRKLPKLNEKKIHLNSHKLFNRLIIIAQRDMTVETRSEYELTPFPLSLFSNQDQRMNKVNKAGFSKTSLKELIDPVDLTDHIRPDMIHLTPRAKFMDNLHNKSKLIHLLSSTFRNHQIIVGECNNDADTSIVRGALAAAKDDSVEVRAENADVLIMLLHHSSSTKYPLYLTTSNGSYDVKKIQEALSEKQRRYLLFCHAFTGCDTVSAIASHGKTTLFHMFCAGDIDEHMDIFLDVQAKKDAVIEAGIAIFQYIYHAPCTNLGAIRYDMFSRKAAAGLIKPEALPPTRGAAAQHSLRAYLQIQDWMLLKSMSLDPSDYGWTLGVHGYEPVPTLDPMAPDELLRFTSCNCNGDCSNRRCSCKKNGVKCISACGNCKGITCQNCIHDDVEPEKNSDLRHWIYVV